MMVLQAKRLLTQYVYQPAPQHAVQSIRAAASASHFHVYMHSSAATVSYVTVTR
jgi:hypothetical protein